MHILTFIIIRLSVTDVLIQVVYLRFKQNNEFYIFENNEVVLV